MEDRSRYLLPLNDDRDSGVKFACGPFRPQGLEVSYGIPAVSPGGNMPNGPNGNGIA